MYSYFYKMKTTKQKYTNSLICETSPYLLQHAHNPVNWYAWNDETLDKAKRENKLILISIGYSACHWCHVMEHESFEDEKVAQLMNDYFICIKIDREERPDIDQIYMMAVQIMTGQGGWPLNCFALPDQRPIYGGTYFQKKQWINILLNLSDVFRNEPEKVLDYAKQLTEGVKHAELVKINELKNEFTIDTLHQCYANWELNFDVIEGGANRAPKFPLPNNYQFLIQYYFHTKNVNVINHFDLTLTKIAYGGIYDQIGGGFSRYSVDHYWKIPHFEKMLYDNAQLVSVYSEAFRVTKNPLYKEIVYETLKFVERELMSSEGAFYSALDADTEGKEGKYYVWQQEELQTILREHFNVFADYFNVNERGLWEDGDYILLRNDSDEVIAKKHSISIFELQNIILTSKKSLLEIREKRTRPGLDDKTLTSWNGLMAIGYIDAYNVFDEPHFLDIAIKNIEFIFEKQLRKDGGLNHNYKNGKSTINGYLEDYCFTIEALIALYESTFNDHYLHTANQLMNYCIIHFQDHKSGMFYFTSDEDTALITRKMELLDNVIPSSNSSIAKSLFKLGHQFENEIFIEMSKKMLNNMLPEIVNYGPSYSNWAMLMLNFTQPFFEIAIVGKSVDEKRKALNKHYQPNKIFAGSIKKSVLPLLNNRYIEDKTLIYVCSNKTCYPPFNEAKDAIKLILN